MTRTKKSPAKALKANEKLLDTGPSGEDSGGISEEPMKSGSDKEDVNNNSTAGDSNTNKGNESTVDGDDGIDDCDADALSVQGPRRSHPLGR